MTESMALGTALAVACGVVQVGLTLALRPDRGRVTELRTEETPLKPPVGPTAILERMGRATLTATVGRSVRRRGGTPPEFDALWSRSVGAAVAVGLCLLPLGPVMMLAGGGGAGAVPHLLERKAARQRRDAYAAELPEVVDLIALALASGLNVSLAVEAVGRRGTGCLSSEMARVAQETRRGRRLAEALDDVARRCGEATRPLMSLLASGERYGVPLGESLERLAVDVRASQRRQAEEAARRLPVKMLFPLVACILPAFALLTLGPLLVTSLRSLSW